ncbi:hypothetical protein [Anaerotignum neopropionicum]|nr:hypothetical protein [Anaerotignum neopropionicum]
MRSKSDDTHCQDRADSEAGFCEAKVMTLTAKIGQTAKLAFAKQK